MARGTHSSIIITVVAAAVSALVISSLTAAEPAGTPEPAPVYVLIKGSDVVPGLDNGEKLDDYSFRTAYSCFELALGSAEVREKYDAHSLAEGGYIGLRRRMGIDFTYGNLRLLRSGMHKWKKDADGKKVRGGKYTGAELRALADFVVEVRGAVTFGKHEWMGNVIGYRADAEVKLTLAEAKTGKVFIDSSRKAGYSVMNGPEGKINAAMQALGRACRPLAVEALKNEKLAGKLAATGKKGKTPEDKKDDTDK